MLFNKFEAWTYEGEYRLLLPSGAHTLLPFEPPALAGLIFGCNARPEFQSTVRDLLAERAARGMPPVRVYKAGLHSSIYKLVVKRFDIGTA